MVGGSLLAPDLDLVVLLPEVELRGELALLDEVELVSELALW